LADPGRTFGRVAEAYVRTRPPYPRAATERMSGRDLVDLHLTASTPASIPEEERATIDARAYPLMDVAYDVHVVTKLYWRRFA
jgi:hypothetical protein